MSSVSRSIWTQRTRPLKRLSLGPKSSLTGVPPSLPTSVVSSPENTIGWVASMRPSPALAPST